MTTLSEVLESKAAPAAPHQPNTIIMGRGGSGGSGIVIPSGAGGGSGAGLGEATRRAARCGIVHGPELDALLDATIRRQRITGLVFRLTTVIIALCVVLAYCVEWARLHGL